MKARQESITKKGAPEVLCARRTTRAREALDGSGRARLIEELRTQGLL
jgi:hypothetical protein